MAFERVGQVCTTCCALIFSDFNLSPFSANSWWLIASALCMGLYIVFWIRYFKNQTLRNFYGNLLGIPVPGASLPVAAFFLLGVYGRVIWMVIAITILGIGHIGIHLQHLRGMKTD